MTEAFEHRDLAAETEAKFLDLGVELEDITDYDLGEGFDLDEWLDNQPAPENVLQMNVNLTEGPVQVTVSGFLSPGHLVNALLTVSEDEFIEKVYENLETSWPSE